MANAGLCGGAWVLLWVCCTHLAAVAAAPKPLSLAEDTTSATAEHLWFHADGHIGFLTRLGRELMEEVTPKWHCLDVFGASGKIRKSWQRGNFASASYDVKICEEHDITSFAGCILFITMLLQLFHAAMVVCGPPCSMFVSASQSIHCRRISNILGRVDNLRVRCANRIWANFGAVMIVVKRLRPDLKVLIEQPSSSWAFHLPIMKQVANTWNMHRITTWMGLFNHDLAKCTHLLASGNFRNADCLARKLTADKRKVIKDRFQKRQSKRRVPKEYYKKTATGWAGGKDLSKSAEYTAAFCNAVREAWKSDRHSTSD